MKCRPKPKKAITAAIRIEEDLYRYALKKVYQSDSNFSRYVRGLIRRDIAQKKHAA